MSSLPTVSVPDHGFDAVSVRMIGPDTLTVQLTLDRGSWVAALQEDLEPGVYTIVVEGFVMGETTYFGTADGITAVACEVPEPRTIPFNLFRPTDLDLTAATPAVTATWSAVAEAQYYRVEHDSTSAFLSPSTDSVSGTSHVLTAARAGWHYVRIRAGHALVYQGRASESDSVFIGDLTLREP